MKLIVVVASLGLLAAAHGRGASGESTILAGPYDGTFESVDAVNLVVGAGIFYSAGYFGQGVVVANVEAGHVWGGHEVFDRTGLSGYPASPALLINGTRDAGTAPDLGDVDFHATMVGHVLAGTGHVGNGELSLLGAGMVPLATVWSGAIATHFDRTEEGIGSFSISESSFAVPYRAFFEGTVGGQADVINSSWGFGDPAGVAEENQILDGLAAANPTVTLVRSAGNSRAVAAPGVGYNGIVVGSLGGAGDDPFRVVSEFSSGAPGDYFDPITNTTLTGVRASVAISAPGEEFALAYYGGVSGSLAEVVGEGNPATDLYYTFNQSGTSFASPVVAGGVALLKDVAYGGLITVPLGNALDTRVLKSVIQAGSQRTAGWNNGQTAVGEVVVTTQALDFGAGSGRLDLETAAEIYVGGTMDVAGLGGGTVLSQGWDFGAVTGGAANDYFFDLAFSGRSELTISLNWFVGTTWDAVAGSAAYGSFADLNLSVWLVEAATFTTLLASSETSYNNTEFLRVRLEAGAYGVRVSHDGFLYDFSDAVAETYGLAWSVTAVPEVGAGVAALGVVVLLGVAAKRRRKAQSF